MQGGGKAQKDKPAGPSHTLEGLGVLLLPSLPGASEDPLDSCPQPSLEGGCGGEGKSYFLRCVIKLFPSCSNGEVPIATAKTTETMNAPPLNKK